MSQRQQDGTAWWGQDDRIARAKDLWENHPELSAEKIGQRLGCSKSAVIGLANRKGFLARGKSPSVKCESTRDSFADLGPDDCRWPFGDVGDPEFHFCGRKVEEGRPYCAEHCNRAYVRQARANGWTEERREQQTAIGRRNFAALKGRDAAD